MRRKERLKILIIAGWYPSAEHPVAGIFVQEQAKAVALYNQVTVLCRERSSRPLGRRYQIEEGVEAGLAACVTANPSFSRAIPLI